MHQCVPSASGRTVAWLTQDMASARRHPPRPPTATPTATTTSPREGFDDVGAKDGDEDASVVAARGDGDQERAKADGIDRPDSSYWGSLGSGDETGTVTLRSSWKPRKEGSRPGGSDVMRAGFSSRRQDAEGGDLDEPERDTPLSLEADDGMYISPPGSPVNDESYQSSPDHVGGGTSVFPASGPPEGSGAQAQPVPGQPPPLLNRMRQAVQQRLAVDGTGGGVASSSTKRLATWLHPVTGRLGAGAAAALSSFSSRADGVQSQKQASGAHGDVRNAGRSAGEEPVNKGGGGARGHARRGSSRPWGVPAWGNESDKLDPLLPLPSSTLPPSYSSRGHERVAGDSARAQGKSGSHESPPTANGDPLQGNRRRRSRSLGAAPPEAVSGGGDESRPEDPALEWPSLLGAIGSKTPRSPPPPSLSARAFSSPFSRGAAGAVAAAAAAPFSTAAGDGQDGTSSRIRLEMAEASAAAVMSAAAASGNQTPSASPPRSPFLLRDAGGASSSPSPPPPPPVPAAVFSSAPPPPLPGTCWGVGVEVRSRLRDRGWLTGTRGWGESGRALGERRTRDLGEGFEPDVVGSLFPLNMALQVRK